jgi:hypothetical protein
MSRTYRCTNVNSKRIKASARHRVMNIYQSDYNEHIDYNDGINKDFALNIRKGFKGGLRMNHNKYTRKFSLKNEKSKFKQKLFNCLKYNEFNEIILTQNKKNIDRRR